MTEAAPPPCPLCGSDAYSRDDDDRREPPGATPPGAEPQAEQATRWNVETDTFEVLLTMADGESVMNAAETSGPRDVALAEALNYARQYEDEGPVQVYEVTRRPVGGIGSRAALPPDPEVDVLIPEPFDCALIVRCAKWCGKEKCRDHDAIAHAELVKAARALSDKLPHDGTPGYESYYLRAELAALRAALPPEGKETP